jgi:hypothetical protein
VNRPQNVSDRVLSGCGALVLAVPHEEASRSVEPFAPKYVGLSARGVRVIARGVRATLQLTTNISPSVW